MESEFEKRMSHQPVKEIPAAWRGDILAAARAAQAAPHVARAEERSFASTLRSQVAAWLWPHPKAWAGLAAVWVGIIGLQVSTQEHGPVRGETLAAASPEMVVELRQQQKLYAELMGVNEVREADRPKNLIGRPRTRVEVLMG